MREPISHTILSTLEHDARGALVVSAAKLPALRQALAREADVRATALTLVELAHVLETQQRSPAAAQVLRTLAGELTPALQRQRRSRQQATVDGAHDRHQRFTAMIGGPARARPALAVSAPGTQRLASLAPARVLR